MGDLSKHFSRHEFRCQCGCGLDSVDYESLMMLEDVRDHFGQIVTINSAHRCESHNKDVGGAENSSHLDARAEDFTVAGVLPVDVQSYLKSRYPGKYGIGGYDTFTHCDTRSGICARW